MGLTSKGDESSGGAGFARGLARERGVKAPPTFFADTPARKGARNVERVFTTERLGVALDTSTTYDKSSAPIFRKTVTAGRFLKELLSVVIGGGRFFGSFKKDKHEETA